MRRCLFVGAFLSAAAFTSAVAWTLHAITKAITNDPWGDYTTPDLKEYP